MARLFFALGSIVCASGLQALVIAAILSMTPSYEGGLEGLLPSVLWIGSTLILILTCPLWTGLFYERWRDFRPRIVRNLLFFPWIVMLAASGFLIEAIFVASLIVLRR